MVIWRILKQAVVDFFKDDVLLLSAGLAFYSALSLAPLLMILLAVSGLISDNLAAALIDQIKALIGERAGQGLSLVISNARQQNIGGQIAGLGIVAMLLSATLVFAHLRSSMNRIWKAASKHSEIVIWLLSRLMALGLVLIIGALLVVSLALSAVLQFLFAESGYWTLIDSAASLLIYMLLFGAVYWLLPSVKVGWRDVVFGSFVTALLFWLGKWGISRYLGVAGVGSIYGAAGSIIVLLVWIYYASIVFFFGAEVTHAYA
ncbi:YihY/virulence factor BrkB family protein, partial [bacterium]|nr:YihY/virulence factor BrkB family protein [bacterium]